MRELRVYGPGGPYDAVKECCTTWSGKTGVNVEVIKGQPDEWAQKARNDGDLMFFGAENMLKDFEQKSPDVVNEATVHCPFTRRVGIIVRKANPHHIGSLRDLASKDIALLAVELEKMDEFFDSVPGIRRRIAQTTITGEDGFALWHSNSSLDAWITYRSWHVKLTGAEEFVLFDAAKPVHRGTPLALTKTTQKQELALLLCNFLGGKEAHAVFRKCGWD